MSTGPTEDNEALQLRTKRAWSDKRESFSPNDINDPNKLDRMRASAGLWDDDLNELSIYPKTHARRAHFKLKSGQPRTVLHKDSPDPTHNSAVDAIHELLIKPNTRLRLVAKAWNSAMKRADVQLWEQHILSDYRWHKEPGTRLLMESGNFLQPDLVGVDTSRMNRTAVNPAIVIEVVHHHWPDFDSMRPATSP